VTGWVAARGEFGDGAFVLFAILFLWQIPQHARDRRLYVDQYAGAGFSGLAAGGRAAYASHRRAVVSYTGASSR
jgi:heme O synthase-like polyprenyltransferase